MKIISKICPIFLCCLMAWGCQQPNGSKIGKAIKNVSLPDSLQFATEINGEKISLYVLKNKNGMEVGLTNFGARIVSLIVANKNGSRRDVVLGFNKATAYNNAVEPYFGPIVGPFANRIAKGKFKLNGNTYVLPVNNGSNTLHGGLVGLHFKSWAVISSSRNQIEFMCTLKDGQEGFPGNRKLIVKYSLNDNNELIIDYWGKSDKTTVLNLTNHAYFNLNGEGSGTILDHQLQIHAENYTPVDSTLIPTGELKNVQGTAFNFLQPKKIGKDINQHDVQLKYGKGFDHNFVLNGTKSGNLNYACRLIGDQSGIVMDIYTSEPGLQFYSGNFMSDKVTLKSGKRDSFRTGLCLEPQHFPDAPNQPSFPSTVVKPNQIYSSKTIYRFSEI